MSSAKDPRFVACLSRKSRPASGVTRTFLAGSVAAALLLAFGGPAATAQGREGNPQHGKTIAEQSCAACHGPDGNSTIAQYPKLAGQKPAYLYRQLWAFKTGARTSDVMSGIVKPMSDADMADAAAYYGEQSIHPDTVKDPALARLGERIYLRGGRGPTAQPACAMCHGSAGGRGASTTGMMGGGGMVGGGMMGGGSMTGGTADVPHLAGQHAAYVLDRLNYFATKQGQATTMGRIASSLSEHQRMAVAAFIAGMK